MPINLLVLTFSILFFVGIILGLKFKKALIFWLSLISFISLLSILIGYASILPFQLSLYQLLFANPYVQFLLIFISILLICFGLFMIEVCRKAGKELLLIVLIILVLISSIFLFQYSTGVFQSFYT